MTTYRPLEGEGIRWKIGEISFSRSCHKLTPTLPWLELVVERDLSPSYRLVFRRSIPRQSFERNEINKVTQKLLSYLDLFYKFLLLPPHRKELKLVREKQI
jgi:hypothetical protein